MTTTNKTNLMHQIGKRLRIRPEVVKVIIQEFIDSIIAEMAKGNEVQIRDFGVFYVRRWEARACRNPQTGGTIDKPAKMDAKFYPGLLLKQKVQALLHQNLTLSTT